MSFRHAVTGHPAATVKNVVPFKCPEEFGNAGIAWTREACQESEGALREAFLTYESSCGPSGLISLVLLSIVTQRQGTVAPDLRNAADFAEIILTMKLRKHQCDALEIVRAYLE